MFRMMLGQIRVEPGRIDANMGRIRRDLERARDGGFHGVAFPELCVSGYLLGDRWNDPAFCGELEDCNRELRALSAGILLVYGNLACDPASVNRDGRMRKFNACFAWQDGAPLVRGLPGAPVDLPGIPEGCTAKTLHPDYRFFDDSRYFYSLRDLADEHGLPVSRYHQPFLVRTGEGSLPLGLEICEDLWFGDYRVGNVPLNVTGNLVAAGARAVVNVSASPWTPRKAGARHRRVAMAQEGSSARVPFLYVNCVGTQDNGKNLVVFDGSSQVYGSEGTPVLDEGVPHAEAVVSCVISMDGAGKVEAVRTVHEEGAWHVPGGAGRADLVARLPVCPERDHFFAALEGISSLDARMGGKVPWVIGVSGGVDSAVVACLVACAIGGDRIVGINMPGAYSSDATRKVARKVVEGIGARWHEIPILPLVEANLAALESFAPGGFHKENIQAKIRGTSLLSNVAGILGGVMTNNGNKVELALGYATLYGDVNGVLCPIGDLLKTEVFALARFLNDHVYGAPVIDPVLLPDEGFSFVLPPTAELRPDQVDPMKWGYHDALVRVMTEYRRVAPEEVLEWYLEGSLWERLDIPEDLARSYGLHVPQVFVKDLEWFTTLFFRGVFKRIQAPPVLVMSRSAFGYDFRESQTGWVPGRRWRVMRDRVLAGPEGECLRK